MKINSLNNITFGKLKMDYPCYVDAGAEDRINKFRQEIEKISKENDVYINTNIDTRFDEITGWTVTMPVKNKDSNIELYSAVIPRNKGKYIGEAVVEAVSKLSKLV